MSAKQWQKTDPGLRSHPRFLDLVEELETTPLVADGLLHGLWGMAFYEAPDGDLTRFKPRSLARAVGWKHDGQKMVDALVASGFLEYVTVTSDVSVTVTSPEKLLVIHDWFEWGGALFENRRDIRKRVARHREKAAQDDSVTVTVTGGNGYPSKSSKSKELREEKKTNTSAPKNGDGFDTFWESWPKKVDKKNAFKKWQKLSPEARLQAISVAELMAMTIAAGGGPEPQYITGPTPFINGERWHDWDDGPPSGWEPPSNGNGKQREQWPDYGSGDWRWCDTNEPTGERCS